ncbi:MAG: M42 family metallopeptidase [bacterium]
MLKELCEICSVSGDEDKIRLFIKEKIYNYVTDLEEDAYGNLIVRKGKEKRPKILLAAHMDEVGMMITNIEKNGFLKFKTIGLRAQSILAKKVVVGEKQIPGVIGHKPIHLSNPSERNKIPEVKDLFIDIGVGSKEEAEKFVQIGDLATFATHFRKDGDIIYGKAFDNRIGCYVLIKLIQETNLDAYFAFTVQEELGLRGAKIVAYRVDPDIAIAVDTTGANESPDKKDQPLYPVLGKGPALTIADATIICDKKIIKIFENTAKNYRIPHQLKQPMIGGTDAGVIHLARKGIPTAVLSTPARYIHSPLSIASMKDIKNTIKLLTFTVEEILRGAKWN